MGNSKCHKIILVLSFVSFSGMTIADNNFSFSGSSGANKTENIFGGGASCFPITGVNSPTNFESVNYYTDERLTPILMPVATSCTSISAKALSSSVVGPWSNMSVDLLVYKNATGLAIDGNVTHNHLCDFNPRGVNGKVGEAQCEVSNKPIDIENGDQLAMCFLASYGTPVLSQVAWNVTCVD